MIRWDAVGWGVPVAVEFAPGCEQALRDRLPFWWWDDDATPVGPTPVRTWRVAGPADVARAVSSLELWVAEQAEEVVFVHAGVVAASPGAGALLLPGFSRAGKSTLVAALVAAGAKFASDEYAVLDPAGRVTRYPRPISRRDPVRREPVDRSRWTPPELPVAALAFTRYDPATAGLATAGGGPPVSTREVTPAAATLRLLEHAVAARSRPARCLAAAAAVVASARCVELVRGEAETVVPALLALGRHPPTR